MAKRSSKTKDPAWWWMEGRAFDSMGIQHWYPLFNARTEHEAGRLVKMANNMDATQRRQQCITRYSEFRVHPDRDHLADLKANTERAKKGRCPACDKKPGKHRTGRKNFYKALKCSRCGHIWCIPGTRDEEAYEAHQAELAAKRAEEEARRKAAEREATEDALDSGKKKKSKKSKKKKSKKDKKRKKKS